MNLNDAAVLKAACGIFADEHSPRAATTPYRLDSVDINLLAQKILLLPEQEQAMLFMRYCYGMGAGAAGRLLEIAHPEGRMSCCHELLAVAMAIDGSIDHKDMELAANRAAGRYTTEYMGGETAPTHIYSLEFRRRLGEISTIPRRGGVVILFARRVAIAALIALMMFTTALAASPALREMVFGWVVNTFPKYSQIGAANVTREPTEADFEILKGYKPEYMPEGYELYQVTEMFPWTIYDYRNTGGDMLLFDGSLQNESLTYYNSEGAVIETLTYLGQPAFYWEQDGSTFFIWQQDGFQFDVVGKVTKEEAIKIANSTKFKKQ